MVWCCWLAVALAGEVGELQLERAHAALELEDWERAAQALYEAREDGERAAHRLYLELAEATGTVTVADAEYASMAETDPELYGLWTWSRIERGLAVEEDLVEQGVPEDLVRQASASLALDRGAPEEALAWLSEPANPEEAALVIRALVQAGEEAEALGAARTALRLWPSHPDLVAGLWQLRSPSPRLERGRAALLRSLVRRLPETVVELYRLRRLLLVARDRDKAAAVVTKLEALGEQRALPRQGYNRRMVRELAKALSRHREPVLPEGPPSETLRLARELSQELELAGRGEVAVEVWRQAAVRTGDAGAWAELAEAQLAVGQAQQALESARGGVRASAQERATPLTLRRRARAHAAEAMALEALGAPEEALVSWTLATGLVKDPSWLTARARLLESLGKVELAFLTYVSAHQAGADGLEAELERTYRGPARWQVAAQAIVEDPEAGEDEALAPEEEQARFPFLGELLPSDWAGQSASGEELEIGELTGTPLVLAFWASWCGPCREELPELDHLAHRLAAAGHAARIIAVGVDERVGDFRRFVARQQLASVETVWSPGLGRTLGVRGIPATWVVSADGVLTAFHQGFAPGQADRIEAELRLLE